LDLELLDGCPNVPLLCCPGDLLVIVALNDGGVAPSDYVKDEQIEKNGSFPFVLPTVRREPALFLVTANGLDQFGRVVLVGSFSRLMALTVR
jgi:hypothetical protein